MQRLERDFFARPTLLVARDLVGKILVLGDKMARISETEAYVGEDDPACHAARGRTPCTEVLYGEAGYAYVYMIYGMYTCLNIVTERKDYPASVFLRAAEPLAGFPARTDLSGPGKLTRAFGIDRTFNKLDLCSPDSSFYICDDKLSPQRVTALERVGITAGCERLWRFKLQN